MPEKNPDLDAAYAIETPEDNRRLYADWAKTYDDSFATDMDYQLPRMVGLIFCEAFRGSGPVLDVGAGTGLLAQSIPIRAMLEMDALDMSPEMLGIARQKGLYRKTIEADLTQPLDIADNVYGAIVSSGTFTHGHVGPDSLDELLRIARRGAIFVLAVNAEHFVARGFAEKFALLEPHIEGLQRHDVNIYGADADATHKDDLASIAVFRKR
ncbi:class I SAM-dependent methyltransferase [Sulfitobacter sp. SK011]|uniref:class I SAM-dependent DNA methyltransferase n=1 Tax=Sulfitobacter sp. SK011 TaxID=1389004 RepID=UPI000E0C651B|nr:class I SAM-dependent methyltransferase [Sulfitobacter sp. SK011]AXI40730.1 SAM-dependent methyltransferase [Sulfitobacter sp. SK011]